MSANTPAGWFRDQTNSERLRWWDGQAWTEHTRPLGPADQAHADASAAGGTSDVGHPALADSGPKKPWYFRWWAITAVVIVALGILGSFLPDDETPESTGTEATASTESSPPEPEPEPEPEPVDSDGDGVADDQDFRPKDAKIQSKDDVDSDKDGVPDHKDGFPRDPDRSKITLAMENALGSAEDYLEYSAFSRQGLIDQLSSEYGSGYKTDEATWAVDQLKADWKKQAVRSAKDYLEYSSFSRQGLIDQLSSEYGAQFTVEEATHAVNKIGL